MSYTFDITTNAASNLELFRKKLSVIAAFSKWGPFIWQGRMYENGDIVTRQWRKENEHYYNLFVNDIAEVIRGLGYEVQCGSPLTSVRGIENIHYWNMITMIKKNGIIIYGDDADVIYDTQCYDTHPLCGNNRLLIERELRNHHSYDTQVILTGEKLKDPDYYEIVLQYIVNGSACYKKSDCNTKISRYYCGSSTVGNTLPNDITQTLWNYSCENELNDRELEFYIPDCMTDYTIDVAVPNAEPPIHTEDNQYRDDTPASAPIEASIVNGCSDSSDSSDSDCEE